VDVRLDTQVIPKRDSFKYLAVAEPEFLLRGVKIYKSKHTKKLRGVNT